MQVFPVRSMGQLSKGNKVVSRNLILSIRASIKHIPGRSEAGSFLAQDMRASLERVCTLKSASSAFIQTQSQGGVRKHIRRARRVIEMSSERSPMAVQVPELPVEALYNGEQRKGPEDGQNRTQEEQWRVRLRIIKEVPTWRVGGDERWHQSQEARETW